jgi:dCMP deaminase
MPRAAGRPSWDDYFVNIAWVVAGRANCLGRGVGALIVMDKRILTLRTP